ncbi:MULTISPECIES: type VII secretion target [Mycobacterium]|uniref:ESX-1 secretion-associated protein n=4 Tax=Mycobacterium TaxID=1763 RepID=A0AAW5SC47_MYCBC|nr:MULTISPECIES: type VII secretion target [Mycobacterium]EUA65436.1 hypothetical protein I553_10733 [Mycobacterium xenopi 4042]KMV21758.1 hypothetical protein ACT16_14845 [Mycobacterium heckeshornense]MCV6992966.1 ESX-1 secretion-associated protein [Mycobacterium bouchedurhonense]MCV6993175.1 ESX-1 secretion-associated protein [Mycobacterium timonense]MDA3641956.1 type VII secretion target [Mycobacterium xenopi]
MGLRVNTDDLIRFAEAHEQVAGEVQAACQPDPALIEAMTSGYGPVGAEFTAAVAEFQSAFFESGSQLSRRYQSHAEHIRQASGRYVAGDDDGRAGVDNSTAI